MDSMYKLGAVLTLKDIISAPFANIVKNGEAVKSKLNEIDGGVKKFESSMKSLKIGGGMIAAGTGMALFTKGLIDANRETSQMQSNLKTLGIDNAGIGKITEAAVRTSTTFKVTRNEVLDAAYDIKSGISSLNSEGVGAMTELAAKTAAATKGSTKQLASLLATVYQQSKSLYKGMDDFDFANKFGNSFAYAVQTYKTEGNKMEQAVTSLSGVAATAGYDIAEQFNVLGMIQNVLPGGEAGTGFRAFVQGAVGASEKLGMSFVDQKGKLLPVVDILEKLKARYGNTIEAAEGVKIKEAFGSDEAMKLINNLWDKTGDLKKNIDMLRKMKGPEFLNQMSSAAIDNIDTSLDTLGNTWNNLRSTMGGGVGAALKPFIDMFKSGLAVINEFAMTHPKLTKYIGAILVFGSVAMIAAGGIMTLRGAMGLYKLSQIAATIATGSSTAAMGGFSIGTKLAAIGQWLLNTALWGCPIVWIIGGLIALGAAIFLMWKNWDAISGWFSGLWNRLKGFFSKIWNFVKEAGAKIISTLWEGIKSKAEWLKDGFKSIFGKIGRLFNNSDAKEGPFSKVSYAGRALITTYNSGIEREANRQPAILPYMKRTMASMQEPSNHGSAAVRGGGFNINISNLIGQLTLSGKTREGNLKSLAQAMAEAIMNELTRYEGAV